MINNDDLGLISPEKVVMSLRNGV